jgi:hypothetical protein
MTCDWIHHSPREVSSCLPCLYSNVIKWLVTGFTVNQAKYLIVHFFLTLNVIRWLVIGFTVYHEKFPAVCLVLTRKLSNDLWQDTLFTKHSIHQAKYLIVHFFLTLNVIRWLVIGFTIHHEKFQVVCLVCILKRYQMTCDWITVHQAKY